MKPDFADAVRKVERAQAHLREFDRAAHAHFAKHPWQVGMLPELRRGRSVIPVGERRPFPDRTFSLIVGDAVHNLRTALDYLISACASALGNEISQTEFPFAGTRGEVAARLRRRVGPAGATAGKLVLAARPYLRGNRPLWAMAELDRQDKHRLVVPTACLTEVSITSGVWNGLPARTVVAQVRDGRGALVPAAEGYEQALLVSTEYRPEIVFARGSAIAGRPCLPTLWAMSDAVARVIQSFEQAYGTVNFSRALLAAHRPSDEAPEPQSR